MTSTLPNAEFLIRLGVAASLGSLIGLDRARLLWAAGLRTHMLVCVGACLVMIVSIYGFNDVIGPHVVLDPSRVAAQVVSGIGFLGAGSIILRNEMVKGLTTAASLWAVAAVGLAVGSGLYVPAVGGTVIMLVILVALKPVEDRYRRTRQAAEIELRVQRGQLPFTLLQKALGPRAGYITRFVVEPSQAEGADEVRIGFAKVSAKIVDEAVVALGDIPTVSNIRRVGPDS
jgi:putative Mg2+ transporter-C (MgtC) family protein